MNDDNSQNNSSSNYSKFANKYQPGPVGTSKKEAEQNQAILQNSQQILEQLNETAEMLKAKEKKSTDESNRLANIEEALDQLSSENLNEDKLNLLLKKEYMYERASNKSSNKQAPSGNIPKEEGFSDDTKSKESTAKEPKEKKEYTTTVHSDPTYSATASKLTSAITSSLKTETKGSSRVR